MSSVPPKGAAKRKTSVEASDSSIEESQKSAKRLETICCICRVESAKKYYPVSLGGRVMVALVNKSVPRNLDSASMSFCVACYKASRSAESTSYSAGGPTALGDCEDLVIASPGPPFSGVRTVALSSRLTRESLREFRNSHLTRRFDFLHEKLLSLDRGGVRLEEWCLLEAPPTKLVGISNR